MGASGTTAHIRGINLSSPFRLVCPFAKFDLLSLFFAYFRCRRPACCTPGTGSRPCRTRTRLPRQNPPPVTRGWSGPFPLDREAEHRKASNDLCSRPHAVGASTYISGPDIVGVLTPRCATRADAAAGMEDAGTHERSRNGTQSAQTKDEFCDGRPWPGPSTSSQAVRGACNDVHNAQTPAARGTAPQALSCSPVIHFIVAAHKVQLVRVETGLLAKRA